MIVRPYLLLLALAIGSLTGAETRDIITLKDGKLKWAYIDSELADKLMIRDVASQKEAKALALREVKSWDYLEMKDGFWPQAMEALNSGRYAVAADLFNNVATTGTREWQKVRGAFEEGNCWDMLGDYAKAGEAFGRAGSVNPEHRLTLDAQYRQGFALARAKKDTEAAKVADGLAELAKSKRIVAADYRAYAIRAALSFNAGNGKEMKENGQKAGFTMRDSPVAYIQFGTFFADGLRLLKMEREAEVEYKRLLATPELNPAEKLPLQLGLAQVMMLTDKPSALVELLRIDALPYGSIDAKCQVRYLAGTLLAAEVKAGRANPPVEQAAKDWLASQEQTARLLLSAAAASSSDLPEKQKAGLELSALDPPEPAKDAAAPAPPQVNPGAP